MKTADFVGALYLCNQHSNELAFATLASQLRQSQVQGIDDQLEVYQVWFGLLNQDAAKSAKAKMPEQKKEAQNIKSQIILDQPYYKGLVDDLAKRLSTLQMLDSRRDKIIKQLNEAIQNH
jgi:hypothetical protein